jgi:tRNA A-37 threonylcarbamoyl transferase component Bud32
MRKDVIYAESAAWRAVIERADEILAGAECRIVKDEGRTRAGIVALAGMPPAFIKRTSISSRGRGIAARALGSRARRALRGAQILRAARISHPRPLAAMDLTEGGAVRASYLLTVALVDADTLSRFALGPRGVKGRDARRRRRILDAVAREVRRMHDAGVYTLDLQETNVMVAQDEEGGFRVYFIDLEDIRRTRSVSWKRRMLNLVHLDRSIGRFLCRAARLAFLYSYLGSRPDRGEARRIVRELGALRAELEGRHARRSAHRAGRLQSRAAHAVRARKSGFPAAS